MALSLSGARHLTAILNGSSRVQETKMRQGAHGLD